MLTGLGVPFMMECAERNLYTTHKAGRAAFGLSCDASFELPNLVYFGSGAQKQIILAAPISKSKVMI